MTVDVKGESSNNNSDQSLKLLLSRVDQASKDIGIPKKISQDLIEDLQSGNDWQIILKTNSILETAINFLLSEKITLKGFCSDTQNQTIADFVGRLPLNGRTGKLKLCDDLGIIPRDTKIFAEKISEIRNFYAHDIRNLSTTLEQYSKDLKNTQNYDLKRALVPDYETNKELFEPINEAATGYLIVLGLMGNLPIITNSAKPAPSLFSELLKQSDQAG